MNFINILALWGYSIFDEIVLTTGIDKEILINSICDECDEYLCVYNNHDILVAKINNFFLKKKRTYDKLYEIYNMEYTINENARRTETTSVESTRGRNLTNSATDIMKVAPSDSSTFENDTSNESSGGENENITDSTTTTVDVTGSIGVITNQDMLEKELKLRPRLNIYEIIARDFYNEFMIGVL